MDINDIAFPNLGVYLKDVPESFSILGAEITIYGLIVSIGIISGILIAVHIAKVYKYDAEIVWDFAIYAVIFSILGARIYYVIFSWSHYKENILSIINIKQGGLAIYGAVIGAFSTLFIYCKIKKITPYTLGDCGVHGLVLGQILGRWGNFFNREAFGQYTNNILAMRLPLYAVRESDISESHIEALASLGENADYIQVHPTFLYESIWNICILIFMLWYGKRRKYNGQMCLVYLGGYGLGRFIIESLRTDQLLIPDTSLAVSQILGISLFVFSVLMHLYIVSKIKKKKEKTA